MISNYPPKEWYNEHIKACNYSLPYGLYYSIQMTSEFFNLQKLPVNETAENQNAIILLVFKSAIDENLQKLILTKDVEEKKDIAEEYKIKFLKILSCYGFFQTVCSSF